MKHLRTLYDLGGTGILSILDMADSLKKKHGANEEHLLLKGKILGMIFDKPSTRTRVSFEAGICQLGGHAIYLPSSQTQISRKEPVKDTARVLSRYIDLIMIRTFAQDIVDEMALHSTIPVINGLTDLFHPCQVLADLMTIREHFGALHNLGIAWVGDGNNMANSWINAAAILGLEFNIACPEGFMPDPKVIETAGASAMENIRIMNDPYEAVKGVSAINTDVWVSMGDNIRGNNIRGNNIREDNIREDNAEEKKKSAFRPYQVNQALLNKAGNNVIVLHCLPAHRGEEITDNVIEGQCSMVFEQAENRLHVQKAIILKLLDRA